MLTHSSILSVRLLILKSLMLSVVMFEWIILTSASSYFSLSGAVPNIQAIFLVRNICSTPFKAKVPGMLTGTLL